MPTANVTRHNPSLDISPPPHPSSLAPPQASTPDGANTDPAAAVIAGMKELARLAEAARAGSVRVTRGVVSHYHAKRAFFPRPEVRLFQNGTRGCVF